MSAPPIPINEPTPVNRARRETFLLPAPVKGSPQSVEMNRERMDSSAKSETLIGQGPHHPLPQTSFKGEAVVAQTLRWVSTAALHADKMGGKKGTTPEIQSALVEGRLMLGTNSLKDGHIPGELLKTIKQTPPDIAPEATDARNFTHDINATRAQTHRHIQALSDFVNPHHPLFGDMVAETTHYYAGHVARHQKILADDPTNAHSLHRIKSYSDREKRTVSSLARIRGALQRDDGITMAPALGKTAKSSGHAEQRIIESINARADEVHEHSNKIRVQDDLLPRPRTNIIIAGTKPPCETCWETEKARHTVAQQDLVASKIISPIRIVRFENPVYKAGNLFGPPPFTVSLDPRVGHETQRSMNANVVANGLHPTYASATRGASPTRPKRE